MLQAQEAFDNIIIEFSAYLLKEDYKPSVEERYKINYRNQDSTKFKYYFLN